MTDIIHFDDKEIFVVTPDFYTIKSKVLQAIWARHVIENVYEMSLYNKKGGYGDLWLVAIFTDGRFVPLSPTTSYSGEEKLVFDYMKMVGVSAEDAHEKILIARAEKWKEEQKNELQICEETSSN